MKISQFHSSLLPAGALLAAMLFAGCSSAGPSAQERICTKEDQGIRTELTLRADAKNDPVSTMMLQVDIPWMLLANDEGVDPRGLSEKLIEPIKAAIAAQYGLSAESIQVTPADTGLHIEADVSDAQRFLEGNDSSQVDSSTADSQSSSERSQESYRLDEILEALEESGWSCP